MADLWIDEPVPCRDPECPEKQPSAQPESDGLLLYYACNCGYEFPAEFVSQPEGNCSLGVPEEVRRAASIAPPQDPQPVFLGTIGRRTE